MKTHICGPFPPPLHAACDALGLNVKAVAAGPEGVQNPGEWERIVISLPDTEGRDEAAAALAATGADPDALLFYPGRGRKRRGMLYLLPPDMAEPLMKWDILQIPLTNRCNLLCAHCGRTGDSHPELWSIDAATFGRYLSRFDPARFATLHIGGDGEQTVARGFRECFHIAADQGWTDVGAITNGALADPSVFADLIRDGVLHSLIISTEGATKETFETVRGFPFERFLRLLETLAEARAAHHPGFKAIFLTTTMRRNIDELPDILDLAARYGVGEVRYMHLRSFYGEGERAGKLCVPSQELGTLPPAEKAPVFQAITDRAAALGLTVTLPEPFPFAPGDGRPANRDHLLRCFQPYSFVHVGHDGEVYPCCQILEQRSLGNVSRQDFSELWRGERYRELVDGLRPGGRPVPECAGCPKYKGYNW